MAKVVRGYTIQIDAYINGEQKIHTIKDLKEHGNVYQTQDYYTNKYIAKGYDKVNLNVIQEIY
jgi:putative NIF3 family GTP cyclohydrolase 1 type 2